MPDAGFEIPGTDIEIPRWALFAGGAGVLAILLLGKGNIGSSSGASADSGLVSEELARRVSESETRTNERIASLYDELAALITGITPPTDPTLPPEVIIVPTGDPAPPYQGPYDSRPPVVPVQLPSVPLELPQGEDAYKRLDSKIKVGVSDVPTASSPRIERVTLANQKDVRLSGKLGVDDNMGDMSRPSDTHQLPRMDKYNTSKTTPTPPSTTVAGKGKPTTNSAQASATATGKSKTKLTSTSSLASKLGIKGA